LQRIKEEEYREEVASKTSMRDHFYIDFFAEFQFSGMDFAVKKFRDGVIMQNDTVMLRGIKNNLEEMSEKQSRIDKKRITPASQRKSEYDEEFYERRLQESIVRSIISEYERKKKDKGESDSDSDIDVDIDADNISDSDSESEDEYIF
jgi:hypothetical protein